MKKILVSGCANCPYLIIWNNGDESKDPIDRICYGECTHSSFNKELNRPIISREVFLPNVKPFAGPTSELRRMSPSGIPEWCPLPE